MSNASSCHRAVSLNYKSSFCSTGWSITCFRAEISSCVSSITPYPRIPLLRQGVNPIFRIAMPSAVTSLNCYLRLLTAMKRYCADDAEYLEFIMGFLKRAIIEIWLFWREEPEGWMMETWREMEREKNEILCGEEVGGSKKYYYLYGSKKVIEMEMKECGFVIRCYEKSELAQLYFPGMEGNAAVDKLRRWIRKCGPLMEEMESGEYRPKMKMYTGREVRLIARHLGEPGV